MRSRWLSWRIASHLRRLIRGGGWTWDGGGEPLVGSTGSWSKLWSARRVDTPSAASRRGGRVYAVVQAGVMKKVLFVDDEPNLLLGLQRILRRLQTQFDATFVSGPVDALAELEKASFDIVVSDGRMPGMDGEELLRHVRDRYPGVVRILLSGHTGGEVAYRSAGVAHQFLTKPCKPGEMRTTLERACTLQDLLRDSTLRSLVGEIDTVPSEPHLYRELSRVLSSEEASIDEVVTIIEQDVGMCAKALQMVNSAFFGVRQQTTCISHAIMYLGVNVVKQLVLTVGIFDAFGKESSVPGFSLAAEQRHALFVGRAAKMVVSEGNAAEDALMAGMLHDIGKLVLAKKAPEQWRLAVEDALERHQPLHQVEGEHFGVTHAEIGAYLLGVWGLPHPIVEAVAFHHAPAQAADPALDAVGAVHIANALVREVETSAGPDGEPVGALLDGEFLDALGVAASVEGWRAEIQQLGSKQQSIDEDAA